MSEPSSATRPRQVTMAGWVGGAASLAMLLSVGEVMSKLHTVDLRQSVADFLATQGGSLNLDVDQALLLARIGLLVTGAASAATLVFAVFAFRRDRSARIAMSVLALPLLVGGVFIDPFLAGFIVAAAVLLWTRPAADWFAGRAPRPEPAERTSETPGNDGTGRPNPFQQLPVSPPEPPPSAPSAPAPFGSSYGDPTSAPVPDLQPGPYQAPAAGVAPAPARPRQVTTACSIAWLTSGLVLLMMIGTVLALQSGQVLDDLRARVAENPALADSGMSFDDLVVAVRVVAVLVMLWAVAAIVVTVFAFRRQGWARITLAVSAIVAAVFGLVSSISFPGFFVVSAAAIATTVLLFHRESSKWYAVSNDPRPGGPPRQPPPAQPW